MSPQPQPTLQDPDAADLSTDEIIAEIRCGDIQAYRQILFRYQGEVMKIVNAMLLNPSDRDEIVQQVFVRAFHALHQYEPGRGFAQWIKAIARNLVREELRKRYRYQGRLAAYANSILDQLDAGADPSAAGTAEEERQRNNALSECIEDLEQNAALAVRLHYLERKRTEEIASVLGRSGGAVRTLLCRARLHLRTCLESKGVLA